MNSAAARITAAYSPWIRSKQFCLEGKQELRAACAAAGTEDSRHKCPCTALTWSHPAGWPRLGSPAARVFCNTLYCLFLERSFQRTEGTGLAPPRPLPSQSCQQQQHPAPRDKLSVYTRVKDPSPAGVLSNQVTRESRDRAINY